MLVSSSDVVQKPTYFKKRSVVFIVVCFCTVIRVFYALPGHQWRHATIVHCELCVVFRYDHAACGDDGVVGDNCSRQYCNRTAYDTAIAYRYRACPDMECIAFGGYRAVAGSVERYIRPQRHIIAYAHLTFVQDSEVRSCPKTTPYMYLRPVVAVERRRYLGI